MVLSVFWGEWVWGRTGNGKNKQQQKQMRGFFASLRMTGVSGGNRTDNGKNNNKSKSWLGEVFIPTLTMMKPSLGWGTRSSVAV